MMSSRLRYIRRWFKGVLEFYRMGQIGFVFNIACNKLCLSLRRFVKILGYGMSNPSGSMSTTQHSLFRNKVRQALVRNLGLGVETDTINTMIFNMKQTDLVRFGWFAAYYHVNRIYRDLFTFRIETVTVETAQGELRGRKCVSALGKQYFRFQGIPYAKPPVGSLRFKDPQPPEPWNGVRDALKEGPICCHLDLITGAVKGSEDCLYLNVFTPELLSENESFKPKAVLVWIHGGGFQIGSGNAEIYSPDFFLEEDVILVTLNYRLGALGFLAAGTEDVPGNAGLKDMVAALKWVQTNIANFGGDPQRVCLFGESAGGAAVQYLVLSPLAKGLFSSAISQSGSALCPWGWSPDAVNVAFTLGKKFGCDTQDPKELVDFLRKIPVKTLAKKQNAALPESNKRELLPFAFVPCAEPPGPNALITESPLELLKKGQFNDVPYITGVNQMEGMIMLKAIIDKKPPCSEIEKEFERLVPRFLNLQFGSDKSREIAKRMRDFYFDGQEFTKKTYKCYIDLTTDTSFLDGMHRSTNYMIQTGKAPVYNYQFVFDGDFAFFKKLLNLDIPGPAHADDIGYLFYVPIIGPNVNPNTKEMFVTKRMVRLWSNFAKTGNPTPDNSDSLLENIEWKPVTGASRDYLEIGENLDTKQNIEKKRTDFWDLLHSECNSG